MKTFIYTLQFKNAKYCSNVIMKIYRIKNNKPVFITEHFYNTGSMKGHIHECLGKLIELKQLFKTCSRNNAGNYVNYDKLNKDFAIYEV
jgi:hypothetical protein